MSIIGPRPILEWEFTENNNKPEKPFAFSNDETGFAAFKEWMNDIAEKHGIGEAQIQGANKM